MKRVPIHEVDVGDMIVVSGLARPDARPEYEVLEIRYVQMDNSNPLLNGVGITVKRLDDGEVMPFTFGSDHIIGVF